MRSLEQITQEIMALPSDSRALLADKIVESLEFDVDLDPSTQQAWLSVAKIRRDEIRNGEITPIDGDDVLVQKIDVAEASIARGEGLLFDEAMELWQ
jgi:hypothetical protein